MCKFLPSQVYVEYRPSGAALWNTEPQAPPNLPSYTLNELSPGISYEVRLGLDYDDNSDIRYGDIYNYETCETGFKGVDCGIGKQARPCLKFI